MTTKEDDVIKVTRRRPGNTSSIRVAPEELFVDPVKRYAAIQEAGRTVVFEGIRRAVMYAPFEGSSFRRVGTYTVSRLVNAHEAFRALMYAMYEDRFINAPSVNDLYV